jgi:CMP-N,N'-diacetyllegionaminic acid synthase
VKVLGVITARGGSKGIPGKNLKLLGGRPLIAYTIDAALQAGVLDRLILSTDDPAIAEAARALGCEAPFLRPPELARDDTPHLPVMQHAVEWLATNERCHPDLVMILQPTSPLRRAEHVRESVSLAQTSGADSVVGVSAVPMHYHPLRTLRVDAAGTAALFVTGEPIRRRDKRRQDLPPVWAMNGAIYLFRTHTLFDPEPSLFGSRSVAYVMRHPSGLSIDDPEDWMEVERHLAEANTRQTRG